jgi:hypothetical protein
MAETKAQTVLTVQRWLRQHPQATDEEAAEACDVHRFDFDLIKVARQNLAADQAEIHRADPGSWQPSL